jgi:hypothetical protein
MQIKFLVTPKFDKSYKALKKKYPSLKTTLQVAKSIYEKLNVSANVIFGTNPLIRKARQENLTQA